MQKSGFPKVRHYVGFWQIGSQMLPKTCQGGVTNFSGSACVRLYTCTNRSKIILKEVYSDVNVATTVKCPTLMAKTFLQCACYVWSMYGE